MLPTFDSLYEMMAAFPDEQSCIDYFTAIRWADGAFCPHCGSTRVYHFSDNRTHKCGDCRKRFSVKVGTIFEDTKVSLRKWFMAVWLLTNHKKGVSSAQLARDIKVTQKTAWFMLQRLRYAAQTKSFNAPLSGTVEVDETYVGGKESNKHKAKRTKGTQGMGSAKTKSVVFGMAERGGELRLSKIQLPSREHIEPVVRANVAEGSAVKTDEAASYRWMRDNYAHDLVNHKLGEYVRGDTHTNTVEGAFSHFKRTIIGIYHHVSDKHVDRYLDMFTYRWNTREKAEGERLVGLLERTSGRLTYKALIA